jgi:hypothetical protein
MGRKGGSKKVKKGFAVVPAPADKRRENARKRWARWRKANGKPPKPGDEAFT